MTDRPWAWGLGLGAVAAWGCSFLIQFDPEGQPCSADGGCNAAEGFACIDGRCYRSRDGGAAPDAGPCALCDAGESCLPARGECAFGCRAKKSALGQQCSTFPFGCSILSGGGVGASCKKAAECNADAGLFCLASPSLGDPRTADPPGFCTLRCEGAGCPSGSRCRTFEPPPGSVGQPVKLCLRFSDGPDGGEDPLGWTPMPCDRESDCADFEGLACTYVDHVLPVSGAPLAVPFPLSFCDAVRDGGSFDACTPQGSPMAANGLCIPDNNAGPHRVGRVCRADADCPAGLSCQPAQLTLRGVHRRAGLCAPGAASQCVKTCQSDSDCGVDAPLCVTEITGEKRCHTQCDPATAPCPLDGSTCAATCSCPQ